MKKKFLSLMMAVALCFSIALVSCSKSNQDLLNEYRSASKEYIEAAKAQDAGKIKSVSAKFEKIGDELKKRDLTEKEREEFVQISLEMVTGVLGDEIDSIEL